MCFSLWNAKYLLFLQIVLSVLLTHYGLCRPKNRTLTTLKYHTYRRQGFDNPIHDPLGLRQQQNQQTTSSVVATREPGEGQGGIYEEEDFKTIARTRNTRIEKRTPPKRVSMDSQCDYKAKFCLRTYITGRLCGRTMYYTYETFRNFCMMDYVNCVERQQTWQVVHMGQCYKLKTVTEFFHREYSNDFFLDHTNVSGDDGQLSSLSTESASSFWKDF